MTDLFNEPASLSKTGVIAAERYLRVPIHEESDVVVARRHAREFARLEGLPESATEALVIATSEIAHNVIVHAKSGELFLGSVRKTEGHGVVVVVRDTGPGIPDVAQALQDGYSTGHGLGLGLSSAKRLMDELRILSTPGEGTTVTMMKWA